MKADTKAYIAEEGGKVLSNLVRMVMSRSRKAATAPESGEEIPVSVKPTPTIHNTQEATIPAEEQDIVATACIPCAMGHYGTCTGLLNEAMRFAKKEGIDSGEVIDRVNMCMDELNAMERVDLRAELIVDLSEWEKGLANKALTGSRSLRHGLERLSSTDDLERVAATTQTTRNEIGREWFKQRLSTMSKEEKAKMVEKAEATQATEEPEMSLEEAQKIAAEEAAKEVEKRWTEKK